MLGHKARKRKQTSHSKTIYVDWATKCAKGSKLYCLREEMATDQIHSKSNECLRNIQGASTCAHVCTGVHMCACTSVHKCAQVCTSVHRCAQVCTGVHKCAQVCTGVHSCAQVCMQKCSQVCTSVHKCAQVCTSVHKCAQVCTDV